MNTWVPPEKPEEAHTRLNPTCSYVHVVDMNFKIMPDILNSDRQHFN